MKSLVLKCLFQVSTESLRLHIDGEIVGERPLSSIFNKNFTLSGSKKITLASTGGDGLKLLGYVHSLEVLPPTLSIKDHHGKVHYSFSF